MPYNSPVCAQQVVTQITFFFVNQCVTFVERREGNGCENRSFYRGGHKIYVNIFSFEKDFDYFELIGPAGLVKKVQARLISLLTFRCYYLICD